VAFIRHGFPSAEATTSRVYCTTITTIIKQSRELATLPFEKLTSIIIIIQVSLK
jgi:hypothetical protein